MQHARTFLGKKDNFYLLLIVCVGICVYFNSLFGSFVWDDFLQITDNPMVQSPGNIIGFFLNSTFGTNITGSFYRPLLSLSFSTLYFFFGPQPFFFHVFQLTIHILNTLLVFRFLKKFFKKKLALFLSLIFLVHPINVEAVSYISGLQEPLFFLFGMWAMYLSLKEKISSRRMILISFLLLCSLLSKETGILFFSAFFLYHVFFRLKKKHEMRKVLLITTLPLMAYIFLRFFVAQITTQTNPDIPIETASILQRFFTMPAILLFYLKTFFFPSILLINQQWLILQPNIQFYIPFFICCLFFLTLTVLGVKIYKKRKLLFPIYIFFVLWFLMGIGLHMQIFPLEMTVADRWFYFPMVGILGMIGTVVEIIEKPGVKLKKILTTIFIFILILLSFRTIVRNVNWNDEIALYSYNVQATDDYRSEATLGALLLQAGKLDEAQQHLEQSNRINPENPLANLYLGVIYQTKGNIPKAKSLYEKILNEDKTGYAYDNLAQIALYNEKNPAKAKLLAKRALTHTYPLSFDLWDIAAIADYRLGNQESALAEAKRAVELHRESSTESVYNAILNHK